MTIAERLRERVTWEYSGDLRKSLDEAANELDRLEATLKAVQESRRGLWEEHEELTAALTRVQADAERYRFLRAQLPFVEVQWDNVGVTKGDAVSISFRYFESFWPLPGCLRLLWTNDSLDRIDAAIDAQLAATKEIEK